LSEAGEEAASRYARAAIALIAVLIVGRLICAAVLPLAFDEAYYWLWSKELSFGYYDHPPMIALVIRLGTMIAGDTQFGVRLIAVLLGIPATWAVWRAATILFDDRRIGIDAALYFNLSLIVSIGTVLATIDAPLVAGAAFVLFFLAKVVETGRGAWWLAVGVAMGFSLLSKYSAFFLGVGIVTWLVFTPSMRKWLRTLWPYLGGMIALAMFAPVVVWNAQHEWASFLKQFGRTEVRGWEPAKLLEYVVTQAGVATPSVFILGIAGFIALACRWDAVPRTRALLISLIAPMALYFIWHSLHTRVQGNWTAPAAPAFALVAAFAVHRVAWSGWRAPLMHWSRVLAVPLGLAISAAIYLQAIFGVLPLGVADPTARQIGAGMPALAREIDAMREKIGARTVLTTDYAMTAWLSFYLPSRPPVVQVTQRFRFVHRPEPPMTLFDGPMLYVCLTNYEGLASDASRFKVFEKLDVVTRQRRGIAIESFILARVEGRKGDPFDRSPPPERQR
jgi:4-amino-4-deoxy-L-arabinose transferase-like glycosyltransferase